MNFPQLLAASDPLDHVVDRPLGDGLSWGEAEIFQTLAHYGLTKHIFMFLLASALTLLFFWSYSKSALSKKVPGRWGNLVESLIVFLRDQLVRPFMGAHGDKFLPVLATFFVFIAIANLLGLVPLFDFLGHGGNTATGSIAITLGLAICAFIYYHWMGIREQGDFWLYVKNLFPHVPIFILPIMIVIELVAHVIRPCALAIRLFANMLAGHCMVAAILSFTLQWWQNDVPGLGEGIAITSCIAVTLLTFLELLVALIQAFVFTFLTTVFLSMAVHPEH